MLLFLYFGIFFFFVVVQLIVVGLLFDEFHESRGAPVYLWWLGRTTPGRTTVIGIWMTVAVRVVFLVYAFLAPSQTSSPSNGKQMDAGTLSLSPRLSVWDNALLAAVHITLLRVFPWPRHTAFLVPATDELSMRVLIAAVAAILQYLLFQSFRAARDRLHRQIASIGTS